MNTKNRGNENFSSLSDSGYAHWLYNTCKCSNADDVRLTQKSAVENINRLTVYVRKAIADLEILKSNLNCQKESVEKMEHDILSHTKRLCDTYCSCEDEPMVFLRFINAVSNKVDRVILKKRYFDGLKWSEISVLFDVPVSTLEKKNRKYIKRYREWKGDEKQDDQSERQKF